MITFFQALILGAVQGIAELFPISSLGHSILIPELFKWNIAQNSNYFLIFLVATHLATALVLFWFFRNDWIKVIKGIFRSLRNREVDTNDTYAKIGWLLIVGTIPAGILGVLFESTIQTLLSSPKLVAGFLLLNGLMLFGVEALVKRNNKKEAPSYTHDDSRIAKLSWGDTIKIGFAQSLALIPGFSRTGASLGGGLLTGLNHKDAARFSFLLATPIIFAAAILKLPELIGNQSYEFAPLAIGFIASGIAAYFSITFLTNYFKTKTLTPFAIYCMVAGGALLVLFIMR